jgi:hypothetical protein
LPAGLDEEQATTTRSAGTIGEKERIEEREWG